MSDSPGAAAENSARALKVISASPSPTLSAACGSDTPAHTAADECAQRRTRARSHFRLLTSSQLRRRLTSFQASDHTEVLSRSFAVGPGSVLRVGVGPRQLLEVLKISGGQSSNVGKLRMLGRLSFARFDAVVHPGRTTSDRTGMESGDAQRSSGDSPRHDRRAPRLSPQP